MNKLRMKARSGVTLVELLVVILIVTILSVSMLPLLQPFVTEAQYAAEAIPVIGSLRTKVGMYQYDKGKLPCIMDDTKGAIATPRIETWIPVENGSSTTAASDASKVDMFRMASALFPATTPPLTSLDAGEKIDESDESDHTKVDKHFGTLCDINYQELKGKRSKPHHYQYLVMRNGTDYAYFFGCFGDGNGLKAGTGYAVCEIVADGHKYVGTWKRYKPVSGKTGTGETEKSWEDVQICFTSSVSRPNGDTDNAHTFGCYVPTKGEIDAAKDKNGQLDIISSLVKYGWEF